MFTIIAFLLTIAGSINWLLIGLLQYDFVAGIFGFQASVFSRLIYIVIGASSVFLVFKLFKGKGTIPVFSRRNKKDLARQIEKMKSHDREPSFNTEASNDFERRERIYNNSSRPFPHEQLSRKQKSLFDEYFDDEDE